MKRKYILIILTICLCIMFSFTLIIFNDQQKIVISPIATTTQKEQISFVSSWGAYDTKASCIKEIFKRISDKYPLIEIEDSSMAGEDFLFILKTDFASGNEPDIFGLWPGSDINLLINEGKVADLTEFLKSDPSWYESFRPETWRDVMVDDHIYGLPIEIIYEGLFVNTDLFQKYHVKIPTNFEELLEAVQIFKENDIIPIAYSQTPEGSYIYQNIVMKLGGKEDVQQPFDSEGHIKSCFVDGMYYMKQLYDAGAFPSQLYQLDDKERNELFLDKKAAMIVQGSWFIGEGAVDPEEKTVDIVPFPQMPGGKADATAIIYGCGNGIFHMSQKAYEDQRLRASCITMLKEMTSPKNVAVFAEETGFISNVDLGDDAPKQTTMNQKGERLVDGSNELVGAVDWFVNRNSWEKTIIKQFPNVLKGKVTPEEVFAKVEEEARQEGVD